MFKSPNTNSPIDIKHFGVGSCFVDLNGNVYLVVPSVLSNHVSTLFLPDMALSTSIKVDDVNYLSEAEARKLLSESSEQDSFSDVTLDPKGFKEYKGKYS